MTTCSLLLPAILAWIPFVAVDAWGIVRVLCFCKGYYCAIPLRRTKIIGVLATASALSILLSRSVAPMEWLANGGLGLGSIGLALSLWSVATLSRSCLLVLPTDDINTTRYELTRIVRLANSAMVPPRVIPLRTRILIPCVGPERQVLSGVLDSLKLISLPKRWGLITGGRVCFDFLTLALIWYLCGF
jgi:hypothetical protein